MLGIDVTTIRIGGERNVEFGNDATIGPVEDSPILEFLWNIVVPTLIVLTIYWG